MSALTNRVAAIEAQLGEDWRKCHIRAQLARFVSGVVVSVIWALHSGPADWTDVLPTVWSSMWVVARQMWPQVPWSLLRGRFGGVKAPEPAPPASG